MIHFFNGYFRRCNPLHLQLEFSNWILIYPKMGFTNMLCNFALAG